MAEIIQQLDLNQTFFFEIGAFFVLFIALSQIYFKPFLKLIQNREERTRGDKESAEKLLAEAQQKLKEYEEQLHVARSSVRKEYDAIIAEAKKIEAETYARAREEAKKITQETLKEISDTRKVLKRDLQADVASMANMISERLLVKK